MANAVPRSASSMIWSMRALAGRYSEGRGRDEDIPYQMSLLVAWTEIQIESKRFSRFCMIFSSLKT